MIEKRIDDIESLSEYGKLPSERFLFRGQTQHFQIDDGSINIPTSFSRHGCIPGLMLKWSHYAKAVVRAYSEMADDEITLDLTQAILQHYGWRSFYIDVTKSLPIACWFASNKYVQSKEIWMCENYEEDPVNLVHDLAAYDEWNEDGHIYIIDKELLKASNINITDLTVLTSEPGMRTRFESQKACLIGALAKRLPPDTISHHLIVENRLLKDICSINQIFNTEDVFPSEKEDYWLNEFLSLPWIMTYPGLIPTYVRSLPLPEFNFRHIKHLPAKMALYEKSWISDSLSELDKGNYFESATFYRLPSESFYYHIFDLSKLVILEQVLSKHKRIIIELCELVKVPENTTPFSYEKGVVVEMLSELLIYVGGIEISHPGHTADGGGVLLGWYYQKQKDGYWKRINHPDQCPCGNEHRHKLQFSLLNALESFLGRNEIVPGPNNSFIHSSFVE